MFSVTSQDGAARCGLLASPNPISTPALLVYTHRGGAPNLIADLLEQLRPELQAVQLDVMQFITQPKPEVLRGCPGGGRAYLSLDAPGLALVATARDPGIFEYTGAMRQSTHEWASVTVHTGAACVTPQQYVEAAAALAPDAWVVLSDEIACDARSDRVPKAVDRTVAWLGACREAAAAEPSLARAALFAAVQGGQYLNERVRCAEAVAAVPGVSGYLIGGLGTGESPELRAQIYAAVLPRLPAAAARLASGLGTPEEVLEGVAQGIDLFDTCFLDDVTNAGYALAFPVTPEEAAAPAAGAPAGAPAPPGQQQQQQQQGAAAAAGRQAAAAAAAAVAAGGGGEAEEEEEADGCEAGGDASKLNLWALAYRTDRRPLLPGCACLACRSHSRAYVHHLLQAHEMTAQVLLEAHNTHHYLRFFAAIRAAVAAGRFAEYRAWFLGQRQRALVGGAGSGGGGSGAE